MVSSNGIKVKLEKEIINQKIQEAKGKSEPKRNLIINLLRAFFVGGLICLFGEVLFILLNNFFEKELANNYMIIMLIFLSALFTCLGVYDHLGQFAGCGSIVPITGFANSMTSAAIESHSEGLILGVVNNIFKLAGSVIVTAIVTGVFYGLIRYIGVLING